jgi:hypothetical protein
LGISNGVQSPLIKEQPKLVDMVMKTPMEAATQRVGGGPMHDGGAAAIGPLFLGVGAGLEELLPLLGSCQKE